MKTEILDALQKLAEAAEDKGFSESVARFRLEKALPAARAAIKELKAAPSERKIIEHNSFSMRFKMDGFDHEYLDIVTTALCDDGTLWCRRGARGTWGKLPPIPQDA